MQKIVKKRSQKVGQPPGSLIHVGVKKREKTKITVQEYGEDFFQMKEVEIKDIEHLMKKRLRENTVHWMNIEGIHDIQIMERLGNCFGLHPLVMEDILNTEQRPKIEEYEDYICAIAKILSYNQETGEVNVEQESFILKNNLVLSFSESGTDLFNPIRERIQKGVGRIRRMGSDYLLYALLDVIVDHYFEVLEQIGERIEIEEEEVIVRPSSDTLQTIHKLKRQTMFFHKAVWPLREVIGAMERGESPLIQDTTAIYIRDLYDHVIQVMDTTENLRDILSSMLDIYLSSTSNKMNEVMKVLTIISTVFIPLSFIVGLYGMNLSNMPEYRWPWMYPVVWVIMLAIAASMLLYFKKKKWW